MPRAARPQPAPPSHVALLRGINVGGKNKLPMKDLAALFGEAGCVDVRTYIQSGNVLFRAPAPVAARLAVDARKRIAERFGLRVPVVLRSGEELRAVARGNPFLAAGAEAGSLYVMFLADAPAAARVARLDPARSPGDEFVVRGRDVYLRLRTGAAKTKLTNAWFDAQLSTVSTSRNWRTVQTLVAMLDE